MESKAFLFSSVPIIALILVFGYLNIQQEKSLNSPNVDRDPSCQNVVYNGEDRIDLLFISSKEDAKKYTDFLLSTEPYRSHKNYFNSYVVDKDVDCEYYKDIAILCNNKEVFSIAKNCPSDYIVVVKRDSPHIRSSAYGNLMSINSVHEASVFIHEFGHSFGNLAEEYGGAKIPVGSKNCVSSCDKFNGEIDSCELECSESNYYRSIPTGVMRSLITTNYGVYNLEILRKLLEKNKPRESTITGNQILESNKCEDDLIEVQIIKSENEPSVTYSYSTQKGCAPDKSGDGDLCIGSNCYPSLIFTDAQDVHLEETLSGEVYDMQDRPLIAYVRKDTQNPVIDVTLSGNKIGSVNALEVGAMACKI